MENILAHRLDLQQIAQDYAGVFMQVFQRNISWLNRESLEDRLKEHETAHMV